MTLHRPSWMLALALAAAGGCAAPTPNAASAESGWRWPWEAGSVYRYLGVAQYRDKLLADVEGEFDELAIAPDGRQVVFRGRESRDAYELFIGEIGGRVRLLAETGLEPQAIHWSRDAETLLFLTQEVTREGLIPDAPPDAIPLPKGKTIQAMTVADGATRRVLELPGMGTFFPSPMNDRVAVYGFTGYGQSKIGAPFDLIDVATGQRQPLRGEIRDVYSTGQAVWSPDGTRLAVTDTMLGGTELRALLYQGPDWQATELGHDLHWPGQLSWNSDGTALTSLQVDAEGFTLRAIGLAGEAPTETRLPLEAAPQGYAFTYYPLLPAPGGRRWLVSRHAASTAPRVLAVDGAPAVTHLLIDLDARTSTVVLPGLTPFGWLDERRVLAYTGEGQAKRLKVIDL